MLQCLPWSAIAPTIVMCVAVCCSMLPYVAVCCSVLQCVAVCCSVITCQRHHNNHNDDTATSSFEHGSVSQRTATHRIVLQSLPWHERYATVPAIQCDRPDHRDDTAISSFEMARGTGDVVWG